MMELTYLIKIIIEKLIIVKKLFLYYFIILNFFNLKKYKIKFILQFILFIYPSIVNFYMILPVTKVDIYFSFYKTIYKRILVL